jgi:hypothetical protein
MGGVGHRLIHPENGAHIKQPTLKVRELPCMVLHSDLWAMATLGRPRQIIAIRSKIFNEMPV